MSFLNLDRFTRLSRMGVSLLVGLFSFGMIYVGALAHPAQAQFIIGDPIFDPALNDCTLHPFVCDALLASPHKNLSFCDTPRGKLDARCTGNLLLGFCDDLRNQGLPPCNPVDDVQSVIIKRPPVCLSCPVINTDLKMNESLLVTTNPGGSFLITKVPSNITSVSNFTNLSPDRCFIVTKSTPRKFFSSN